MSAVALGAPAKKLVDHAETIADGLLEAALSVMFEPSVAACDALTATATGAIAYARTLRLELMKDAQAP